MDKLSIKFYRNVETGSCINDTPFQRVLRVIIGYVLEIFKKNLNSEKTVLIHTEMKPKRTI